ncbi:protocadherin beta-16-like [Tiliqua scincoides]|uniref:protocadherin beta-16-like n=1 Tax=Tiliqua scincoides TaxID=71010 RepID=UPI0034627B10
MTGTMEDSWRNRQGLYLLLFLCLSRILYVSSIQYSVSEEKKIGSVVTNVLKDLKLLMGDLSARRAQLVSKNSKQYFHLDTQSGNLLIQHKIDREALCGKMDPCLLLSEIVLQNPLKIYSIETLIEDVNDNNPTFSKNEFELEIPENVPVNTRFPLDPAQDPDLGENSIQNYTLSPNEHFRLDVQKGKKYLDLVLVKPLDREKEEHFGLTLKAIDGGVPPRTGSVGIKVSILDINDNFPQFAQNEYKMKIKENSPQGSLVSKVEARDSDAGSNAQITYSFHQVPESINILFQLNEITGEITVWGEIDYEKESNYEMNIKATDGGGLSGYCKVLVEIEDENDNAPELSIISLTSPLPEDSPLDTLVALLSITDIDSGDNGQTSCSADISLPFLLKTTVNNYYQLVIQSPLDREKVAEYNVTITAIDRGVPRLSSTRMIHIQILDINDNSPVFEESAYQMALQENNIPGLLIGSVHAVDLDTEQNAKVTYSFLPGKVGDISVASYLSINSESGNVYILRSLDYEEINHFQVTIRASDGGSPPLTSDATVHVVVIDENDNAPFILYPLQNSTSLSNELVPRPAEAGYLVTKVVAVDEDSGQNSWLSYQLLKATDPTLFSIGPQNGEVKTRRPLNERDPNKQRLVILVRDNGNPPQTSTTALNVLLVDSLSDPYRKNVEVGIEEREEEGPLTMYLVICLAAVSFVFLVCIVVFVIIKMYKKGCGGSLIAVPPHFPPARPDIPENGVDSENGSLSRTYHYDVCLTGGSLCSEFRFLRPFIPVFSVGDPNMPVSHRISAASQEIPDQVEGKESTEEQGRTPLSEDAAPRPGGPGCIINQATGAVVNSGQNDWLSYQ